MENEIARIIKCSNEDEVFKIYVLELSCVLRELLIEELKYSF